MNRSGDGDVGDEIARSLLAHSVNLTSSKACGKGRITRQNLDMDCGAAGTEDDRKLHGTRSRPLKIIRVSPRSVGMKSRLQIGGSLEKRLRDVEPSISRSAAFNLESRFTYSPHPVVQQEHAGLPY